MLSAALKNILVIGLFALYGCQPSEQAVSGRSVSTGARETKTVSATDAAPYAKEGQDVLGLDNPDVLRQREMEVSPYRAPDPNLAGEFFNIPVPKTNYYFAKKAVATFGASWRPAPQTESELEDLVWQELLFSYEAFRRGIQASDAEIDEEIEKTLKDQEVAFDWKEDKAGLEEWSKQNLGLSAEGFRNQIEHLIKLEKLRKEVIESFDPPVTEEEAFRKFLDEYNSLSVELIQFTDLQEAAAFYQAAKKPVPDEAFDALIIEDLILRRQAQALSQEEVSQEEIDKGIDSLLRLYEARIKWREDDEAFRKWLKDTIGISKETFLKYLNHFAVIDALRVKLAKQELEDPRAGADYRQFLEKYKSLDAAYKKFFSQFKVRGKSALRFKDIKNAKDVYEKMKRFPGIWEDKKPRDPENVKRPGFVALDFLIHMWGFKRNDAYRMIDMNIGGIYPPSPIYRDYAVFRILNVREADPAEFEKRRERYFDRVKNVKKYETWKEWVKELKEKAAIKIYNTP